MSTRDRLNTVREATAALERWALVEPWIDVLDGDHEVRVTWAVGASVPGYEPLRAEISRAVNDDFQRLALAAIERIAEDANAKLREAGMAPVVVVAPTPRGEG